MGQNGCCPNVCSLLVFSRYSNGKLNLPKKLARDISREVCETPRHNDKPIPKNMSMIPTLIIADQREFEKEKEILKQKIIMFQRNGPEKCTTHPHPFFGKLTSEQWGKCIYKHLDHHLKQFGV